MCAKYEPNSSVQDDLEVAIASELTRRFAVLRGTLKRLCDDVQVSIIELILQALLKELRLRYSRQFRLRHRIGQTAAFDLDGKPYTLSITLANVPSDGTLLIQFTETNSPKSTPTSAPSEISNSLLVSQIEVRVPKSLRHFFPAAIDVVGHVARAASGWLQECLRDFSARCGSKALNEIRALLDRELGPLADRVMFYPYGESKGNFYGRYLFDADQFDMVLNKLRQSVPTTASRGAQMAALIETKMGIELTASRKALGNRSPLVLPSMQTSSLVYESGFPEFFDAECKLYGRGNVVCQPVIFADELRHVQLVVVYPALDGKSSEGALAKRIEALRPQIRQILAGNDLLAPVVEAVKKPAAIILPDSAPEPYSGGRYGIVAELQQEISESLDYYIVRIMPLHAIENQEVHLEFVSACHALVRSCTDVETLTTIKLKLLHDLRPSSITAVREILDAYAKRSCAA